MKPVAVTNNSLVYDTMYDKSIFSEFIYEEHNSVEDVFRKSMQLVKKGHRLLMNPFVGNVPPQEMPFKTIILSPPNNVIDFYSVLAIDDAIRKLEKLSRYTTKTLWDKNDLSCFKNNDLVIVERWFVKVYCPLYTDIGFLETPEDRA